MTKLYATDAEAFCLARRGVMFDGPLDDLVLSILVRLYNSFLIAEAVSNKDHPQASEQKH